MSKSTAVPQPNTDEVLLFLASCQYSPDVLRTQLSNRSLESMYQTLEKMKKRHRWQSHFLIAGDSIYADRTGGLFDPIDPRARYGQAYQELNRRGSAWPLVRSRVNVESTIDDHEIDDNWEPLNEFSTEDGGKNIKKMLDGKYYFLKHIRKVQLSDRTASDEMPLWNSTELDGLPLFLMDTRTEREGRTVKNWSTATLFDKVQKEALKAWLKNLDEDDNNNPDKPPVPKLIMSGSMLLPRRLKTAQDAQTISSTLQSDSWDGYPASRHDLLAFIAEHQIRNVILLSGDEHLPCCCSFTLEDSAQKTVTVHSIHGSPLYAPYRFANAHEHEFAGSEQFKIPKSATGPELTIQTSTQYPRTEDGYVQITIPKNGSQSVVEVQFIGHEGEQCYQLALDQTPKTLLATDC